MGITRVGRGRYEVYVLLRLIGTYVNKLALIIRVPNILLYRRILLLEVERERLKRCVVIQLCNSCVLSRVYTIRRSSDGYHTRISAYNITVNRSCIVLSYASGTIIVCTEFFRGGRTDYKIIFVLRMYQSEKK